MDEEDSDTSFGCERFTQCLGCDAFDSVNDLGLCASCAEKLDQDLMQQPDLDYAVASFGVPESRREELRAAVIARLGRGMEFSVDKNAARMQRPTTRRGIVTPK